MTQAASAAAGGAPGGKAAPKKNSRGDGAAAKTSRDRKKTTAESTVMTLFANLALMLCCYNAGAAVSMDRMADALGIPRALFGAEVRAPHPSCSVACTLSHAPPPCRQWLCAGTAKDVEQHALAGLHEQPGGAEIWTCSCGSVDARDGRRAF